MTESQITHSLTWPWVVAIILGLALLVAVVALIVNVKKPRTPHVDGSRTLWVANSDYIRSLPAFKRQIREYRTVQALGVFALIAALVGAAFLSSKPVAIETKDPRMANRDIILCLDISGSMLEYDRELVNVFSQLTESFVGERIALSIFNSTSRLVFPLTDDYTLVREQLRDAYRALDPAAMYDDDAFTRYHYFTAGANTVIGESSSLIGDGLANCALAFDDTTSSKTESTDTDANAPAPEDEDNKTGTKPEERSKSIIFATDNDLRGEPIYTLQEATDLALSKDISLIGLYGAGSQAMSAEQEYRQIFTNAGGMYFYSDDAAMIDTIVQDIQSRQAVEQDAAPLITITNVVGPWFALLVVGVLAFFIIQRRLGE